jgi:hypothetical protein
MKPLKAKETGMAKQGKVAAPKRGNPAGEEELDRNLSGARDAGIEPAADREAYRDPGAEGAALLSGNDPTAAVLEAAVTPEFEILEEFGKEGLEAAETAALSLAGRFRQYANESSAYAKELLDFGYAFAGELRQAKSPLAAVEIQIDFARMAYIRLLDHLLKISEFYWSPLREGCKAAEREPAKAKC